MSRHLLDWWILPLTLPPDFHNFTPCVNTSSTSIMKVHECYSSVFIVNLNHAFTLHNTFTSSVKKTAET